MPEQSTNLFVVSLDVSQGISLTQSTKGNLPSNVTEESLGLFFAKIGPVGTVKIMWRGSPHTGSREVLIFVARGEVNESIGGTMSGSRWVKAGLQGFVAFMKRKDAETAVKDLDGMDWGGSVLRVGWSKPVTVPARAIYDLGNGAGAESSSRRRERERSYSISRSPSPPPRRRARALSRSPSPSRSASSSRDERSPPRRNRRDSRSYSSSSRSPSPTPPPKKKTARERWLDKIPPEQAKFIKAVAVRVKDHGKGFEEVLREREKENPKFLFLFNSDVRRTCFCDDSVNLTFVLATRLPSVSQYAELAISHTNTTARRLRR